MFFLFFSMFYAPQKGCEMDFLILLVQLKMSKCRLLFSSTDKMQLACRLFRPPVVHSMKVASYAKGAPNEDMPDLASPPPTPYILPSSASVRELLGGIDSLSATTSSSTLILERGFSSDDDLQRANDPLGFVLSQFQPRQEQQLSQRPPQRTVVTKDPYQPLGFSMLKRLWAHQETPFTSIDF